MSANHTDTSPQRFLTVGEAAVELNVSEKFIRRAIEAGDLKHHRLGARLIRLARDDLDAFIRLRRR